jgi:hypothetical protein
MDEQQTKSATDTDKEVSGKIAATPGHVKAQAQKETGEQVAREVAAGKPDEATDRTGRYR